MQILMVVKCVSGGISSTGVVRRDNGIQVEASWQTACESMPSVPVPQPCSCARGCP